MAKRKPKYQLKYDPTKTQLMYVPETTHGVMPTTTQFRKAIVGRFKADPVRGKSEWMPHSQAQQQIDYINLSIKFRRNGKSIPSINERGSTSEMVLEVDDAPTLGTVAEVLTAMAYIFHAAMPIKKGKRRGKQV